MAQFITVCPHCNSALQVQSEWIGQKVECPICHNAFVIPPPVQDRITPQTVESAPKKKKVIITLSIIIAALLGIGITAVTINYFAEQKRIAEELKTARAQGIQFSDGNKTLVKCPENVKEVVIPSCVTEIKEKAFRDCSNLQSVTIPDSVTYIGEGAFGGCNNLRKVTIPLNCKVGKNAFSAWCEVIRRVDQKRIAEELKTARAQGIQFSDGNKTLVKCPENVKEVVIPSCVTAIGNKAFDECKNLRSVTIPNSVTKIGNKAFRGCSNLQSVNIPDSVTYIGEGAFGWCTNLQSVTIPDSVTYLGFRAFNWCTNLQSVTVSNSVTYIRKFAFLGCTNLQNVIIPDGVTEIGEQAFGGCTNLQNVIIPDSVTNIGVGAFWDCSNLQKVTIPRNCEVGKDAFPRECKVIRR